MKHNLIKILTQIAYITICVVSIYFTVSFLSSIGIAFAILGFCFETFKIYAGYMFINKKTAATLVMLFIFCLISFSASISNILLTDKILKDKDFNNSIEMQTYNKKIEEFEDLINRKKNEIMEMENIINNIDPINFKTLRANKTTEKQQLTTQLEELIILKNNTKLPTDFTSSGSAVSSSIFQISNEFCQRLKCDASNVSLIIELFLALIIEICILFFVNVIKNEENFAPKITTVAFANNDPLNKEGDEKMQEELISKVLEFMKENQEKDRFSARPYCIGQKKIRAAFNLTIKEMLTISQLLLDRGEIEIIGGRTYIKNED